MSISHSFLNEFEGSKKAAAIAALPEWRKKGIIERSLPGTPVGDVSFDVGVALAGADFAVFDSPIQTDHRQVITTHKAIVRQDNGLPVGVVGKDFGTVQHADAFWGLKQVCERGDASLECVEVVDGGARVTATALLGFSSIVQPGREAPDSLAHFLRAQNAHDGSASASFGLYTLRLTCLNGQTSNQFLEGARIRHNINAAQRVFDARHIVSSIVESAKEEAEQFQRLANSAIALKDFVKFASELLVDIRGDADTDRKKARRLKDVQELSEYFCEGQGNLGETKYDAFNAVTEWLTPRRAQYEDAKKFASKFRSNESGTSAKVRQRALQLLTRSN